ncbi:uncharacterized protein LOC107851845 [Capsicum annuum]|uniref:uncharacterized protein LOC107851845 n=1 Tax=Capsicum annuum TaxID=4072 RepID=UPI0007BF9045|nr:uncharacterized protein LOC107851845 [Capsicum annuum]
MQWLKNCNLGNVSTNFIGIKQEQYCQLMNIINKSKEGDANMNMTGNVFADSEQNSIKWIIDSGATNHIVGNDKLIKDGMSLDSLGGVQLPNGESAAVSQIGKYDMSKGEFVNGVLCVPAFKFNLLSMSKLTKELKYCVTFFPGLSIFQDLFTGEVKEISKEEDGLYTLLSKKKHMDGLSLAAVKRLSGHLLHKRMGHAPMINPLMRYSMENHFLYNT